MSTAISPETTATTWNFDASHSSVEFSVRHLMFSTVRGSFSEVSGELTLEGDDFENGSVAIVIKTDSVNTRDTGRDQHLRSNDFFGTEADPEINFVSTGMTKRDGNKFDLAGNLTIKGITKAVVLDAEFNGQGVSPFGATVAAYSASGKINRQDFGITWNASLETGGVLVSDEVKIQIDAEFQKQA